MAVNQSCSHIFRGGGARIGGKEKGEKGGDSCIRQTVVQLEIKSEKYMSFFEGKGENR